jgi:AraC-like DNA-binding protein
MTIALSQVDHWALFRETEPQQTDSFDITYRYPAALGQGYYRKIKLRDGLELTITKHQLHQDVVMHCPEREHPLEYCFFLSGELRDASHVTGAGQYLLCGSGIAPAEKPEWAADEPFIEVSVHIKPELFMAFWNSSSPGFQLELHHLFRSDSQPCYWRSGTTTISMKIALQQILQCPFNGITKWIYLESKVWELMSLLIDQELERLQKPPIVPVLRRDDIDRIYHAREILLQRLDNPPSLVELARQVGLNDCTLKRGFRQVFGKTAFSCLHDYRLEQACQLLLLGEMKVEKVARAVGYANRSRFAAAFRHKFGLSPKEYQLQHRRLG